MSICLIVLAACVDTGDSTTARDIEESSETTISELGTSGDGISSNLEIPLVAVLWSDSNFGGIKGILVQDTADLTQNSFNDAASAVGVHPGPNYQSWKNSHGGTEPTVTLWEHANFAGRAVTLTAGGYADLRNLGFNDIASAVRFNENAGLRVMTPLGVGTIGSIPLVVGLYQNVSGTTVSPPVVWVVEPSDHLSFYGFNDKARGIRVLRGPNYAGHVARLCRDASGLGGCVFASVGNTNLNDLAFSNVASSVFFQ